MNLPNYFLADVPETAVLGTGMISEACQTLKRNRDAYLRERPTASLLRTIDELGGNWLRPDYSFRKLALSSAEEMTGFSAATVARGLDSFFRELSGEKLEALINQSLGDTRRLDQLCATSAEQKHGAASMARGPEFLVQLTAGAVPTELMYTLVLGLLLRSAQFIQCHPGEAFLLRLFAHSLYDLEPKLGACLEVAAWPAIQIDLTQAILDHADAVLAMTEDGSLDDLGRALKPGVRFLHYGDRVSFGYVSREVLSSFGMPRWVARAAADVVAWNQRGSLSPHVIYVERGGRVSEEEFAEMLARALEEQEKKEPQGTIPAVAAAAIAQRRALYQVRAAHSPDTRQWCSTNSTAWTVVYEADPRFQISCLNRFVYVKPVPDVRSALESADQVRGRVATVGLAAADQRALELASTFARWGVNRVCSLGQMQSPSLTARPGNWPSLADLVTWTDWEQREV